MKLELKKIIANNIPVKIISFILGYSFWYILSQSHTTSIWLNAPVCFYNTSEDVQIESYEKVRIQLSGKRIDLYTIDKENLAFHVDMQSYPQEQNIIKLTDQQLLLPDNITLARCKPSNIAIKIKQKEDAA